VVYEDTVKKWLSVSLRSLEIYTFYETIVVTLFSSENYVLYWACVRPTAAHLPLQIITRHHCAENPVHAHAEYACPIIREKTSRTSDCSTAVDTCKTLDCRGASNVYRVLQNIQLTRGVMTVNSL